MVNASSPQSTNHIMLMEPVDFHANPETMATNSYQHEDDKEVKDIHQKALEEFRAMRDLLVEHGVIITTTLGQVGCPDDIFPNWISTHHGGRMILYPMLTPNRQQERRPDIIETLRRTYKDVQDFTLLEQHDDQCLEATGAMCLDRVNKIAYQVRSLRSHDKLAAMWCKMNEYTHIPFDTEYKGKPVYHADVVMWIGSELVGVCSECLLKDDIVTDLKQRREVIEFTNAQMEAFCGNSLEVIGTGGEKMLIMSAGGYESLRDDQKSLLGKYYKTIIKPKIPTIEYYGGGSARCMLLELF